MGGVDLLPYSQHGCGQRLVMVSSSLWVAECPSYAAQ